MTRLVTAAAVAVLIVTSTAASIAVLNVGSTGAVEDARPAPAPLTSAVLPAPIVIPAETSTLDRASRGLPREASPRVVTAAHPAPTRDATPTAHPAPPARVVRARHRAVGEVPRPLSVRGAMWERLVACEAPGRGWRYGAPGVGIDAGYRYEGGPNFAPSTWREYRPAGYLLHAYDATRAQQTVVAELVLDDQGVTAWPVCGPRVGLVRR